MEAKLDEKLMWNVGVIVCLLIDCHHGGRKVSQLCDDNRLVHLVFCLTC